MIHYSLYFSKFYSLKCPSLNMAVRSIVQNWICRQPNISFQHEECDLKSLHVSLLAVAQNLRKYSQRKKKNHK